jgi:ligand-binding SRPBCC domain-containing protein
MRTYVLEREQVIPRSRSETFAFFSDAFNLERITPSALRFRIMTRPPVVMAAGTLLEYRLSLFGISFYWKTKIESWTPEQSFVDVQLSGPYSFWRHTHAFEELGPDSTLMRDRVEYRLPLGVLGRIAGAAFVRRMLDKIFDYRAEMTARLLATSSDAPGEVIRNRRERN